MSGSNDCKIKIWSASTGECLRTLVGHEALVRALSFDVRSGRLVSASYDKSVKVWDLCSGAFPPLGCLCYWAMLIRLVLPLQARWCESLKVPTQVTSSM